MPPKNSYPIKVISAWRRRPSAYLVSYPKSGRTWVEFMVKQLYHDITGIPLTELVNLDRIMAHETDGKPLPSIQFGHGLKYERYSTGAGRFPSLYYLGAKVVLMVRDPRDVAVSGFYYHKHQFGHFEGSLVDYLNVPPEAKQDHLKNSGPGRRHPFGLDPILNYVNSWVNHRRFFRRFLALSYESLHADPVANLNKLAQFIGLQVSHESLEKSVNASQFEKMRNLEESGELKWSSLPGSKTTAGYKTRCGEVGGYRNEIPDEEIGAINRRIRQKLNPFFSSYFD